MLHFFTILKYVFLPPKFMFGDSGGGTPGVNQGAMPAAQSAAPDSMSFANQVQGGATQPISDAYSFSKQIAPQLGTEQVSGGALTQSTDKPWYDSLIHGGGNNKMMKNELNEYATIKNQLQHETDPEIINQLSARAQELSNPDRGGALGALGRAITRTGQTPAENIGGGALKIGVPLIEGYIKQMFANQANEKMMQNTGKLNAAARARMAANWR